MKVVAMALPQLEEEGVLREWAPMSKLLQQIPIRMRQGIFLEDLKMTCMDAIIECIVLGTNCGTVFWYDREMHNVQQLRPEKGANLIRCVKVVSTVDFMVACGDISGIISIFRIPKKLNGTEEKIERYTVDGLHKANVTALEWSKNGQKLFSGDSDGLVVFTEMDYVMNLSKAREILNEKYSIVQLSYNQREQILLVSSKLRCIICHGPNSNHKITQVGQRERSSLQLLGGTMVSAESGELEIYSCRGGLKLWKANLNGEVLYTLLFKEALQTCKNPVKLLKEIDKCESNTNHPEFGKIYDWRDGLFVSFTKSSLIVFDPVQVTIVATLLNVREIVWACVTRDELFLISGERDLIRLGYTPDIYDSSIGGFGNMATGECVNGIPDVSIAPVYGSPILTSNRNSYLSALTANSELSTSEVIYGMDPSVLPPIVSLQDGVPELRVEPSRYQQFTSIGQQGFDDIIYSQKRLQKHKNRRKSSEMIENRPKSEGISFDGFASYVSSLGKFLSKEFSSSVCDGELVTEPTIDAELPQNILPDLRDLNAIVKDVSRKEVLLEASLETLMKEQQLNNGLPSYNSLVVVNELQHKENEDIALSAKSETMMIVKRLNDNRITSDVSNSVTEKTLNVSDKSIISNDNFLANEPHGESFNKCNSETANNNKSDVYFESSETLIDQKNSMEYINKNGYSLVEKKKITLPLIISDSNVHAGWHIMSCPDHPTFLSTWDGGIVICTSKFNVYHGDKISWTLLDYKAQSVIVSNSGSIGVRIHCSVAQYSDNWMNGDNWNILCRDVQHVAVSNDVIWFISRGELFYLSTKENKVHLIPCDKKLSKISHHRSGLLAITVTGSVMKFENDKWDVVKCIKNCTFLCTGPNDLIWFRNTDNQLFVTDTIKDSKIICWLVSVTCSRENEILDMSSSNDTIFALTTGNVPSILFNETYVTGNIWDFAKFKLQCNQIAAAGIFEEKGCIWVLDATNQLIALDISLNILEEVVTPCNIVSIASAPGALWLLSDDGSIFLRTGISYSYNTVGINWRKLDMEQLNSRIELVQLSCGPDAVWACDIRGKIVMIVGSPHHIAEDTFIPAWVEVDGKPLKHQTFTKVYVGPETYMVWALDNSGNIYVREGIFPYHPVGTGWVHVPDIKASHLAIRDFISHQITDLAHCYLILECGKPQQIFVVIIPGGVTVVSGSVCTVGECFRSDGFVNVRQQYKHFVPTTSFGAVYALNKNGIYRRVGITQSNYIGDTWKYTPIFSIEYIAASFDGNLWGVCSKTKDLIKRKKKTFPLSADVQVENGFVLF